MIIPIGFLKTFERIPYVNIAIISLCVGIFLLEVLAPGVWINRLTAFPSGTELPEGLVITDVAPFDVIDWQAAELVNYGWPHQPWSLVTCAFLHADLLHLVGNMIFLFVFGCALNSDLGHLRYAVFYAMAAIISSSLQIAASEAGGLGASGAICGVTGLVAALYPRNDVRIFYWFYVFTDTIEVSAIWVIFAWFAFDIFGYATSGTTAPIGYVAHLSGSLFGFMVGLAALKWGWVESEGDDAITWLFGGTVARFSKDARRRLRQQGRSVARAPVRSESVATVHDTQTEDFAPIPMAAIEDSQEKLPPPPPLHERIDAFAAKNPRDLWAGEVEEVLGWYDEHRRANDGVPLKSKSLLVVARLAASRQATEVALHAYMKLLARLSKNPDQRSAIALEAAQCAIKGNQPKAARDLANLAAGLALDPKQQNAAHSILARLPRE